MGRRRIREMASAFGDKAAFLCATDGVAAVVPDAIAPSPHAAVLRATAGSPANDGGPDQGSLDELLLLGSRSGAAVAASLAIRLRGASRATVALRSLLALRFLFLQGTPALRDSISSSIADRNPLIFSSFRDESSADAAAVLSPLVRWLARVLEILIAAAAAEEDILSEIRILVELLEEIENRPETSGFLETSALVREVERSVEADRLDAQKRILHRVMAIRKKGGGGELGEMEVLLGRLEGVKDLTLTSDRRKLWVEGSFWEEMDAARSWSRG